MEYTKKKNKLRVAILISNPAGWKNKNNIGGGEILTSNIINLNKKNIEYTVITSTNRIQINKFVKTIRLKLSGKTELFSFFQFCIKSFYYLLKNKNQFDLFYASTTNISEILPVVIAGKICKKKTITKYHLSIYKSEHYNIFKSVYINLKKEGLKNFTLITRLCSTLLTFYLLQKMDCILCVSGYSYKELKKYINPKKLFLCGNGIDIKKLTAYKTQKKIYEISYMGRLEKYKGINEFLHIAKSLNLNSVIMGSGSEETKIQKKIERDNLKNIEYLGFVKNKRFDFLAKSKFLLVLSRSNEGFGLTVAESLAVGTEVIILKNKVLEEIYKNIKGVTFVNSVKELVQLIKFRLSKNNHVYSKNVSIKCPKIFDIRKTAKLEVEYLHTIYGKNK